MTWLASWEANSKGSSSLEAGWVGLGKILRRYQGTGWEGFRPVNAEVYNGS